VNRRVYTLTLNLYLKILRIYIPLTPSLSPSPKGREYVTPSWEGVQDSCPLPHSPVGSTPYGRVRQGVTLPFGE